MSITPFFSLILALVLGAALGAERRFAGKTAGMRTYALVSMGSCLFILISRYVIPATSAYSFDPMRVAAGVIMGIGFLCGGAIYLKDSTVSGLTTAAGLWVAAGIGMAVGYGLTQLAMFATIATLFIFIALWFIENLILKAQLRKD